MAVARMIGQAEYAQRMITMERIERERTAREFAEQRVRMALDPWSFGGGLSGMGVANNGAVPIEWKNSAMRSTDLAEMNELLGMANRTAISAEPKPVPAKPSTDMLDVLATADADLTNGRVGLALEAEDLLGYTALRTEVKAPSRLQRVLAGLEIDVFQDEKVESYKEKMRLHFQTKADNADRERIVKQRGAGRTQQTIVSWRLVDLKAYKKPVPEHVLRKCVQIKKEIPEANFLVDELVEETRTLDPFMIVQLGNERAVVEVWDEPQFEE